MIDMSDFILEPESLLLIFDCHAVTRRPFMASSSQEHVKVPTTWQMCSGLLPHKLQQSQRLTASLTPAKLQAPT
jgi:hypothetical protein